MSELRAFTCDGGCGANTILDRPAQSLADHQWLTTFTPYGLPTLHTCSVECMVRALLGIVTRGLPR